MAGDSTTRGGAVAAGEADRSDWCPEDGRLAYRPSELAALVGMSTKTIYRAIDRGELRAVRVSNGTRLLVPAVEARAWLSENLVEPRVAEQPPRLPRRLRHKRSELRPLAAVFEELDLGRSSGYDRQAT